LIPEHSMTWAFMAGESRHISYGKPGEVVLTKDLPLGGGGAYSIDATLGILWY